MVLKISCPSGSDPVVDIRDKRYFIVVMTRGKLTWIQRCYLAFIWYVRVFGVLFASAAVFIVASNLADPRAKATGELSEIAIVGTAFFAIGCAIYIAASRVLRWYRRRLP